SSPHELPGTSLPSLGPGNVADAVGMYVRDLQGVRVQFDALVRRNASMRSEGDRVKELSKQFSENVGRLQRITSRLSALIEVGLAMNAERDPQRLVHLFFAAACDLITAKIAAVAILDEDERKLRHVFAKG